jgi:hypothetical protein
MVSGRFFPNSTPLPTFHADFLTPVDRARPVLLIRVEIIYGVGHKDALSPWGMGFLSVFLRRD